MKRVTAPTSKGISEESTGNLHSEISQVHIHTIFSLTATGNYEIHMVIVKFKNDIGQFLILGKYHFNILITHLCISIYLKDFMFRILIPLFLCFTIPGN